MKTNKKGDISIGVVFSISVTVIGIMLLLILAGKTSDGKKFYCTAANQYAPKFYNTRMDSFCYGIIEHEISGMKGENLEINSFSDKRTEKLFTTTNSAPSQDFYITIERETTIKSASINVTVPSRKKLKTFSTGDYNLTLPPYPFGGGIQKAYINISKEAVITNASIRISGANYPLKADFAFAIDTSGSMANEWQSVCNVISDIGRNLSDIGVDEFRIRTYRISDGKTYSTCTGFENIQITKEQMKSILISNFVDFKTYTPTWDSQRCGDYTKTDDYTEAWALASAYLSLNAEWIPEAKRIEILISDSDPTGGYYLRWCESSGPQGIAYMSGNEEEAIEQAKAAALDNRVSVSVIYGDESPPPEGFSIGCLSSSCCTGECSEIMGMMQELSSSTGGKRIAFRDTSALQKAVLEIVMSEYPHDVSLSVDRVLVASKSGILDLQNSPWNVSGTKFISALQSAIDSCTPDEYGRCLIQIEVNSSTDGTVILDGLEIAYKMKAEGVSLKIEDRIILPERDLFDESVQINFLNELNSLKSGCTSDYCTFKLTISSEKPTELISEALSIKYRKFFIREELTQAIAECWTKARFGQEKSDFFCQELPVASEYEFIRSITEADIANVLKARQWCHIIGDSDYGCGDSDSIKFTQNINTHTNILIEYKAGEKAVVVS